MTNDEYGILINELQSDPLGVGYVNMSDEEAAAALNAPTRTKPDDTLYTLRKVLMSVSDAATLIAKLDAVAESNPIVAEAMRMLRTYSEGGGLSFAEPATIAMIEQLHAGGVLTQQERDELLAIGKQPASRAEELGLPEVYPGHIESARLMIGC